MIELLEIMPRQDKILRELLQFYQYDFSEIEGGHVGDDGRYHFVDLTQFWALPDARAFLCQVDGKWAGFAMVCKGSFFPDSRNANMVEEFFVMRGFRGRGIGMQMANRLFALIPGEWQFGQTPNNEPARKFWQQVVRQRSGEPIEEITLNTPEWHGTAQRLWVMSRK